jgi:short-subunit dehydrogenase
MDQPAFLNRYGPWALVTGASDGIGRAFATRLAGMGFNLTIVARRADRLRDLADQLMAKHSTETRIVVADLSTPEGLAEVDRVTADLDVGLLVASAGYGTSGPLLQSSIERERNMLDVNCFATLHQCMVFGNRFARRGRGGMILMASILGWQGVPGTAHYSATKAYVQSLAEALHVELEPKGIDVLAVAPTSVASGFAARANMRMDSTVPADTVARQSLDALGRKGTVIPGALSKLMTYALVPLPRPLRTRVLARVMAGMTRHQAASST